MDVEATFILCFVIITVTAKLMGALLRAVKLPKVVGELLAGIILGPTVINTLKLVKANDNVEEAINIFSSLGVIIIMFYAAFETTMDMKNNIGVILLAGLGGVVIPFASMFGCFVAFGVGIKEAIFMALSLSATSVAVSVQTLKQLGQQQSKAYDILIFVATIDDISILVGLSIFESISKSDASTIGVSIGRMVACMGAFTIIGLYGRKYILRTVRWVFRDDEDYYVIMTSIIMMYALAAEVGGTISAITGAFAIGLTIRNEESLTDYFRIMAEGFIATIFFVSIGLFTNMREMSTDTLKIFVVILITSIVSKIAAGYVGSIYWLSKKEAAKLSIGMVGRGEVGLILASKGLASGTIDTKYYNMLILIVILTTVITPLLLRLFCRVAP